ncbi:hypothetical protein, partial [Neisseria gonorrhoeae]|uniref:hypothetical protein n=1 Tax=Neisseria gonorrhoeae TaxID=485 RepID=UPI00311D70FE
MTMTTSEEDVSTNAGVDLFALMCARRGWDQDYLERIEDNNHDQLRDIVPMIECLEQVRAQGLQVTIAPDFDMDGIASGILGYAGLAELGFKVNLQ